MPHCIIERGSIAIIIYWWAFWPVSWLHYGAIFGAGRRCLCRPARVRRVLQGLTRQAAGRGRGQADPLTTDDVAAILATASLPRRTGRGMESEAAAADRGATDRAANVQDAVDGRGIVVYVRQSKTDQDGTAADVRYLKNGCAAALRQLRDRVAPIVASCRSGRR